MANDIKIGLLISADGTSQTIRDLQAIQAELEKQKRAAKDATLAQADAQIRLAQSLGVSLKNAREFTQSIGLQATTASGAVSKLGELDRAGASLAEKFRVLGREFGINRQQFEALNANYNANTRAQEGLARTLGISIDGARNFAKETGLSATKAAEAVERYRGLSAVGADLSEKQRVLTQELGLTAKQFDAIRGAALASQEGLAGLTAIAGGVAAALGGIGAQAFKVFAEFDQKIRTFGVIAEATPKGIEGVRTEIERLGTTTQKTPGEVADLATELAKAGFKANQVKDALAGVVLASQATGEPLARTGEVIGNIINQFQLKAADSSKIADLLVATSNASASGVNDLGEALSYAGTQAAQSGQSLKDTLFALGQLANAGIKGSSAGTGLAEALRRLKLASANANTEFNELRSKGAKSSIEAFRKINEGVRDARGQLLPLPQILKALQKGLGDIKNQGDKDLIMNALFGVQGGRVVQTLIAGNAEQVNGLKEALDNSAGSAKKAGEALSQGPQAALQQLQAATTVALIRIGELISTSFLPLIDVSQLLLTTFNALPAPLQAIVVGVGGVAAALASATAAVTAYNLAKGATIVQETLAAAATVKDTVVKGASIAATYAAAVAERALGLASTTVTAAQIGRTIATAAGAVATGAASAATAFFTGITTANTAALAANAAAAVAAVAPYLAIAAALAGVAVAFGAVSERLKLFEPANKVREATDEFKKFRAETDKEYAFKVATEDAKNKIKDLNGLVALLQKNIAEKGVIGGAIATIDTGLSQNFGSKQKFGQEGRYVNQDQAAQQQYTLALEESLQETNSLFDQGQQLLTSYGAGLGGVGDKAKLSGDGLKQFSEKAKVQIDLIEKNIETLKKQGEANPQDKEAQQTIQFNIAALERQKAALQKVGAAASGNANALQTQTDKNKQATDAAHELQKALEDIADVGKKFNKGAINADAAVKQLEAIKNAADQEVEARRKASEEILKIREKEISEIDKQLKTGQISQQEALSQLQDIQSKSAGDPEAAKAAADAIVKIKKDQIEAEIATIEAGQAAVEALQANGNIGEAKAAEELSQLKIEETQKRIEAVRAEQEAALDPAAREKLKAEEAKLQSELTKIQAKERDRRNKERLKDYDEQIALLESSFSRGNLSESEFNSQKSELQQRQADEEIKQQRDALNRLQSDDKEGREAINAKIAEVETKKAKILADAQRKELELLKAQQEKALAIVTAAETQRSIETQKLINQGIITQEEAENRKGQASRDRLKEELRLAQENATKVETLAAQVSNPEAARQFESEVRAAKQKTADITLKLLEAEFQEQERIRKVAIAAIERELAAKQRAADLELAQIESVKSARDRAAKAAEAAGQREIAALDFATRSLDRQNSLLSAKANLQKALSDAQLSQTQSQIDLAKAAGNNQLAAELTVKLAQQKVEALKTQQAQEQAALQLEIKKNELAAKRQLIEAQIAELKAKQAVADAQSALQQQRLTDQKNIQQAQAELAKAQQQQAGPDRDRAIADAQAKLTIAEGQAKNNQAGAEQNVQLALQQADLASQATAQAQDQQRAQAEINQLQEQTLKVTQATALKQAELAVQAEREAAARERSAKAAGATPGAGASLPGRRGGGSVVAGQAYLVGESEPEVFVPGVSGTILNQAQIARNLSAFQAAQALAGVTPTAFSAPSTPVRPDSYNALLQEVQQLRAVLQNPKVENTFLIEKNGQDEYRRMADIAATVARSRWS